MTYQCIDLGRPHALAQRAGILILGAAMGAFCSFWYIHTLLNNKKV